MKKYLIKMLLLPLFYVIPAISNNEQLEIIKAELLKRHAEVDLGKKILKKCIFVERQPQEESAFWFETSRINPMNKICKTSESIKSSLCKTIFEALKDSDISNINGLERRRLTVWAIYGIAKECKPGTQGIFEEGMVLTEDQKRRLLEYLLNGDHAYKRISSHLKHLKQQHYGIDFTINKDGSYPLLHNKTHILFGKTIDGWIFIKPESFGVKSLYDILMHGIEYFESLGRKNEPMRRFFRLTSDQDSAYKKERIDPEWIAAFKEILQAIEKDTEKIKSIIKKAGTEGVQIIEPTLRDYANNLCHQGHLNKSIIIGTEPLHNLEASAFNLLIPAKEIDNKILLEKIYALLDTFEKLDNLEVRTGNEVILTNKDLQQSLRIPLKARRRKK